MQGVPPPRRTNQPNSAEDFISLLGAAGLKERILFTLAMIALYRIGVHIPIPGVDPAAFMKHPELAQSLLGMIDLFTGGALNKLSIFSMGIGPYITSSIVMQMMSFALPALEEKQKSGEQGRKEIQQYTRYLTVILAFFQSIMLANLLTKIQNPAVVLSPGPVFMVGTTIVLTSCAVFIMWLGEIITERGVGNGASLLIFLGIAARLPVMVRNTAEAVQTGQSPTWGVTLLCVVFLALVALIVTLQLAVRKVIVLGARRNVGRQVFAAPDDYLGLPVNPSGVMAIIFASSLLMFPSTVMQFVGRNDPGKNIYELLSKNQYIGHTYTTLVNSHTVQAVWSFISTEMVYTFSYYHWEHSLLYFTLIVFFAYFYASIIYPTREMAENLRRSGRAIQGVRPGRPTAEFLEKTLNRLICIGAVAVGIIAILPIHVEQLTLVQTLQGLGSTSLIILVGVALDTRRQILTHALSARYQARGLFRAPGEKKGL
jgi:preprotein translocase subunit SecY